MKFTFTIITFLFSQFAFSCDDPIHGEKYNKLITVNKKHVMRDIYDYNISFPANTENRHHLESSLIYESKGRISVPLNISENDNQLESSFTIDGEVSGNFSIHVIWDGDQQCMIIASQTI